MGRRVITIYVVDPDTAVHEALDTLLNTSGVRVVCFADAESFLESGFIDGATTGLVLIEAELPGMGSLALLKKIQSVNGDLPVAVLTSTLDRGIAEQVVKAGAVDVVPKPLVSGQILEWLRNVSAAALESTI